MSIVASNMLEKLMDELLPTDAAAPSVMAQEESTQDTE